MLVGAVILAHSPLLNIRVFAKLQMMCTCSGKLCSSFELKSCLCVPGCPSPFSPSLLAFASIVVCKYVHRVFSVWWCLVVVSALWVAVIDTCAPYSRLAFCLTPPPTLIGKVGGGVLPQLHLLVTSLICKMWNNMPVTRKPAREDMNSTNWPRSQCVASQVSWSSIAPVNPIEATIFFRGIMETDVCKGIHSK